MTLSKRHLSRAFFAILSLFVLAACGSKSAQDSNTSQSKSVIVVGAGIAGLNAASILDKQGYEVTVLESRDRIGGRLWSDKSMDGTALDLGASWIHGIDDNPVYELAQEHNVNLYEWNYEDSAFYDTDGNANTVLEARMNLLSEALADFAGQARFSNSTLDNVIATALSEGELSGYSQLEIDYVVNAFIESEFAAPSSKLSVASLIEGDFFDGPEVIFPEGYDQLTTILSQDLRILTRHSVTEINYDTDKPIVIANGEPFSADYVLVTVPLGVLKKDIIQFTPRLPTEKLLAINALGMGTLNKVYMRFPNAFWEDEAQNIEYLSDPKGQFTYWLNLEKATQKPILLGFMSGDAAEDMESQSDEDIVSNALQVLRNIYGRQIPEPEQYIITRWNSDPHSFGSYSFLGVDANNDMRADLGAPVDERIFFAGEATHEDYPSTVHGAYLSGEREANRIIESDR